MMLSHRDTKSTRETTPRARPRFPNLKQRIIWCHGFPPIVREPRGNHSGRGAADAVRTDETFGSRLRRLRKASALSQADVAKWLGVSTPAVCAWESDKSRPKPPRITDLATILGVSVAVLTGEPGATELAAVIAHARATIAAAIGTTPDRINIHIDLQGECSTNLGKKGSTIESV